MHGGEGPLYMPVKNLAPNISAVGGPEQLGLAWSGRAPGETAAGRGSGRTNARDRWSTLEENCS